jgi:kynurenine 3-monooxygenase
MSAKEDLQNTPEERARAAAAAGQKLSAEEEAALFASAPEVQVGGDGQQHIVLAGAGLVGSLAAVILLRKGFKVHIYERYSDIRSIPSKGRSINLSVTSRGLRAIKALGGNLSHEILNLMTKIRGRIIHMPEGDVLFQRYGKDDTECNYSVSRFELNCFLIDVAAKEGAEYHWNHSLSESSDFSSSDLVGCTLNFTQEQSKRIRVHCKCPVIACDGAGSRIRMALCKQGLSSCTEDILPRGYKEVLFPDPGPNHFGAKGGNGNEECDGRYGLHIWPRGEHMLMALSNRDGSFTGTIYMDNEGENESFAAMDDTEEGRKRAEEFCNKYYSKAVPLVGGMDAMVSQITTNPTGILGTVRTSKWAIKGKVLLIGDSCHAMVPFFGQGCNCGFEDTLWLSRFLDQYCCEDGKVSATKCTPESFAACFEALEQERKPSAEAICDMALENFVEMRDKTGDVKFQAMKKVENLLENRFPEKFRSRYAMVCYGGEGNVSYANAKKLGIIQMDILESLCEGLSGDSPLQDQVDYGAAEKLIDSRLVPEHQALNIDLSTVRH